MFYNVGRKIKSLAKTFTWIGIIFSVSLGIVISVTAPLNAVLAFLLGVLIALAGSVLSWMTFLCLYGFGQLIENSDMIAGRADYQNNI